MRTSTAPGNLEGRVAVVTGASRGLGAEIARTLAGRGARLVLAARDEEALTTLACDLEKTGGRALVVPTDVTVDGDQRHLVERTVSEFGRLDLAVNNAGGGFTGKSGLADVDPATFRSMIELNLSSVFVAMTQQVKAMLPTGGAIVNISSGSGIRAAPGMGAYVVAKHGLQGLTKLAALDYADQGIRINAVAPGPVLAGPLASADAAFQQQAADAVPMQRIGDPAEVAATVAWLCSEEASYVTGATIAVDGGQVAGGSGG